jgi:ribonucleoside-diphosphate reductase alpha chain
MRTAKSGDWFPLEPQRQLANNSVAYQEKPEIGRFMNEWISLYESKSGERGIFNREACQNHVRRKCPLRDPNHEWLTNPCCEIILRNRGLCNLSEVVIRADDTPASLREKVRIATIIGTWQASLTDFRYVSARWRENCEQEYLLGVSLTGIMDNAFMSGRMKPEVVSAELDAVLTHTRDEHLANGDTFDDSSRTWSTNKKRRCEPDPKVVDAYIAECTASPWRGYTLPKFLEELKEVAIETNKFWAHKINIGQSHAITCVKPSGTVSQLVDSASGIHTRHAKFYIRTVRGDVKDPLTTFLKDQGVPWEPDAWKPNDQVVFSFPVKAPADCVTRDDQTALDQLEICKIYNEHWCQHKVSVTINVKEHEWLQVGSWVYDNFDNIGGISFLPHSDHSYKQAPYQECTEEEYLAAVAKMPKIDWKLLSNYESTDMTNSAKELACTAGSCELH